MTYAIEIEGLTKEFPGITAIENVSFKVRQGSIHGFLGPNGAGKSTTMKIMVDLIPATSGKISFVGGRSKIGYLPEVPPLYGNMKVVDYLQFIGQINGNRSKKTVLKVMEWCSLGDVAHRLISNLSKGYRQRVGIAQTLVFDAPILILDEPMSGLDPQAIKEMRDLIKELSKDRTIIFSSHQLHEINLVCDEITIINKGKIIQSGPLESLSKKFQSNQVLNCELERWNNDLKKELIGKLGCESIEETKLDSSIRLRLFLTGDEDHRAKYSDFFVAKGCGLLSIQEEKINLEEIFALSMKGDQ